MQKQLKRSPRSSPMVDFVVDFLTGGLLIIGPRARRNLRHHRWTAQGRPAFSFHLGHLRGHAPASAGHDGAPGRGAAALCAAPKADATKSGLLPLATQSIIRG
jgi:hypothetical protein